MNIHHLLSIKAVYLQKNISLLSSHLGKRTDKNNQTKEINSTDLFPTSAALILQNLINNSNTKPVAF